MGNVPASARFVIKRNARRPFLRMYVKDQDDNAFDFTGALSAVFILSDSEGTLVFSKTAVIESPATSGYLSYEWGSGDTDTAGEYRGEFDVDYGGGQKLTVPVKGSIVVRIYEDLDNA